MDKLTKFSFTALLSALFAWCGYVAVPFIMLVVLSVLDYITGLVAAKYRAEPISSYKSLRGIFKKIFMWCLVPVGGVLDWLITYAAQAIGIDAGISFIVAVVVAVWLMCNEIISILENMVDIGVALPPFLVKITQNIKSKVEDAADTDDKR